MILLIVFTFLFKNQKAEKKQVQIIKIVPDPGLEIKPKTPNVRDLILAGAFKRAKDRSPLWKNFDDRGLEHPNFVNKKIKYNRKEFTMIKIGNPLLHPISLLTCILLALLKRRRKVLEL